MAAPATQQKKNYIKGSARARTFDNGGTNINLSLNLNDLNNLPANKDGYIKITISELKTPDRFGNTHAVYEDTWKPSAENQAKKTFGAKAKQNTNGTTDDLPF